MSRIGVVGCFVCGGQLRMVAEYLPLVYIDDRMMTRYRYPPSKAMFMPKSLDLSARGLLRIMFHVTGPCPTKPCMVGRPRHHPRHGESSKGRKIWQLRISEVPFGMGLMMALFTSVVDGSRR